MVLKCLSDIHPNQRLGEDADHCFNPINRDYSQHPRSISCGRCFKELPQKYNASVHYICTIKIQIKIIS